MTSANLQRLAAPWSLLDLQRARDGATAPERAALLRAWLATHRREWAHGCFPSETRYGFDALPRATLLRRLTSIPRAVPGRSPWRYAAEMYRGCGKTAGMRLIGVLGRGLHGDELGALLVNRNADMASPHSRAIMGLVPERRARQTVRPDTPFARLYPGVCWTGSVEAWTLHVPHLPGLNDGPSDFPVFTRGIGGDLRGFLNSFTRPTLAIFDDVETADSARSPTERESVWRAITEEAAGIAPEDIGLASIIIGEVVFGKRFSFWYLLTSVVLGSVIYRVIIAVVLQLGLKSTDLKLLTAVIVAVALALPVIRTEAQKSKTRRINRQRYASMAGAGDRQAANGSATNEGGAK